MNCARSFANSKQPTSPTCSRCAAIRREGSDTFVAHAGGFRNANDLVGLLEREFDFCIGAACYPEKHPEAGSFHADLDAIETKVKRGSAFPRHATLFRQRALLRVSLRAFARAASTVPVIPGIMPITNYEQIDRFTAMCGATIPLRLCAPNSRMRRNEPEAVVDLGVAFATLQCVELLDGGAPGMHFYTLNKSPATRAVVSALQASRFGGRRVPAKQSA